MNFFTRLAVAALALALAALAPARATTYTTQYSVTNGAYVSLGAGPLQVTLNIAGYTGGVYLIVADAQPAATALGEPLDLSSPASQPRVFTGGSQVWARAIQSAGAVVQATTGLAGGAAAPMSVAGVGSAGSPSGGVQSIQGVAGGTPIPVSGSSGGYNFQYNSGAVAVANSSHAANVSIGGLITASVFRTTAQPSGLVNNVGLQMLDGETASGFTVYLFRSLPANVTTCSGSNTCCKDNTAFALVAADAENLIVPPFGVTPAQYSGVTGFSFGNYLASFSAKNGDGTATTNIYACVVVNTTYTPAANSLALGVGVVQD